MKTDKEKLTALIEESTGCTYGGEYCDEVVENEIDITNEEINRIADYLLASGVVVERKRGEWEVYLDGKYLMCSACKASFWDEDGNGGSNFCPNCGADMRGEKNAVD